MKSEEIIKIAAKALDDKKAIDLSLLKVDKLTSIAEYFLIATASSSTHVRALADQVEDTLNGLDLKPHHIEGKSSGWLVIDYASVIVHIFTKKEREYYDLDRMWSEAEKIDIDFITQNSSED